MIQFNKLFCPKMCEEASADPAACDGGTLRVSSSLESLIGRSLSKAQLYLTRALLFMLLTLATTFSRFIWFVGL